LQVAREFEDELNPLTPEAVADRLEAALAAFWSDPVRHKTARFGIPAARLQVISEAFAGRFAVLRDELTDFFPGARETIEMLKRLGVLSALVTNGGTLTQRARIERFVLAPYARASNAGGRFDVHRVACSCCLRRLEMSRRAPDRNVTRDR